MSPPHWVIFRRCNKSKKYRSGGLKMMSFFNVLRCIFCCEDEESPSVRKSFRQCGYTPLLNDDSISHAISPGTFNPSSNQCTIAPPMSITEEMNASPSSSSLVKTFQHHETDNSGVAVDLHPSSVSVKVKAKKKRRRNKKTCEHIASHDVSSVSPQTSESFPTLPSLSNSFGPSTSTSEHQLSNPENYRKNHILFDKDASPTSLSPKNFKSLIEKDTSPASSGCTRTSVFTSEHPPSSLYLFLISVAIYAKLPSLSIKPTISLTSSNPTSLKENVNHNGVEKGTSTNSGGEDIKSLIEKDIVPEVLKKPLSMSTHKEYFQALLYAEDFYLEKWDGFEMKNVTLQLHDGKINMSEGKSKTLNDVENVEKTFVEFELDKIPERRPFLLSRDSVTVRPLTKKKKTFQGIVYHVVEGNLVLAEFGDDFHSQHDSSRSYDVKFSFNRVCSKRAHQAISDASDNLLRNFVFPNVILGNKLYPAEPSVAHKVAREQILTLQGSPPYILEGPLSGDKSDQLGVFVVKTLLKICQASSSNKILLCAPTDKTCDMFVRSLEKEIPESDMFRVNAPFQELNEVPEDILPTCLCETEQECFSCPPLKELCKFKVIISTYMSCFRLHNQGITAGHFSHIFLVDASSISEPETLVPLANFANEETTVIVIGARGKCSGWIRSTMARENGLGISYFERLCNSRMDENYDPHILEDLD